MNRQDMMWLIGLIEGEGSFTINIAIRSEGGFAISPMFRIALTEKDEKTILSIRKMLGFGRVEFKPKEIWERMGMMNVQSQFLYVINKIDDAIKFIKTFDSNLFKTSKKKDYLLWVEATEIIKNYIHLTYEGFMHICEIRDQMNLIHKRKNYRNKEWFINFLKSKKDFFSEKNVEKRKKASIGKRRFSTLSP